MSLAKKIYDDIKSALKGGDKKRLSIARYIYSCLLYTSDAADE